MKSSGYGYTAIRLTIFGILVHYAYSVMLFAVSQVSEGQSILFKTVYLGVAGFPVIALSILTLRRVRRLKM